MDSIWKNKTWTVEPLPPGRRAITCKWVFKLKPGLQGQPPIKKARLVAQGFEQGHGIDFEETFAPIIKWATIRTTIALVVAKRWDIHHMDVRTAFLHGLIKEQLYMSQPPGFRLHGKESHVCRLYKSLYGLKQSPRAWYERIDAALRKMGLRRSISDANLYFMHQDGETLIVLLYVDDLFITGSSPQLISWLKTFLHKEFDMTDLGLIRRYLGISFEQVLLGIFLHQRDYTSEILKEFGMVECKPASAPLPEGLILTSDMKSPSVDPTHYCRLIGKLIFLMVTRPDVIYAVSRLSSYMAQPQTTHLDTAKHLLRYLQGTMEYGILYQSGAPTSITGFTDANWGSCTETCKSIGAYVFMLAGNPITWQCKRQLEVLHRIRILCAK